MHDLNHQLKQICHHNRDGRFATQADRERLLTLCANDLTTRAFFQLNAAAANPKQVAALLDRWTQDGISTGTLKNHNLRMILRKLRLLFGTNVSWPILAHFLPVLRRRILGGESGQYGQCAPETFAHWRLRASEI